MPAHLLRLLSIVVILFVAKTSFGNELDLPNNLFVNEKPDKMMRHWLLKQVDAAESQWQKNFDSLKTPQQIAEHQKTLRAKILEAIGGLPERTPLNAKVTGKVSRPGYTVEKVIFESQPKHFVTALLFLPDPEKFKGPYPGVIVPCGHAKEGKGYEPYQQMGALLALNGMVGMVFDPIDQGERGQYFGQGGWPDLWGVAGHIMVGLGSILLGENTARFEIWDGMRAIDYLQSRPEVDPKRIGCVGTSGGGTQTSYLMALDDRITVAAPSCYLTSMIKLLKTIGPQDAEQNIAGQLAFGLEHADWITLRAPLPILVCAATKDFFDISGTWDSFRYAKRVYARLGYSHCLDILEADEGHGLTAPHRVAAVRWFNRWFSGKETQPVVPEIKLLSTEEYQCTADGKVMTLPGARSVYDINAARENELAQQRKAKWQSADKTALLAEVRRLAGIRSINDLPKPGIKSSGKTNREGYSIEKLVISPEDGILLPALWFSADASKPQSVVLYLHEQGKAADAGVGGPIEQLVKAGKAVLAVDIRGTGQTQAPNSQPGYSPEYQDASIAYLLGKSYVGMRAEDVLVCARYAAERSGANVELVAIGNVGIPALHAAALEPAMFANIKISKMLSAWAAIIHERLSKKQMANIVHGALRCYDLPDLIATLGEKISVTAPVNASGNPLAAANPTKK